MVTRDSLSAAQQGPAIDTSDAAHSMTTKPAVSLRALHKHYGEFRAVDGLSLDIAQGEFYGLLGVNGAGKTTTLRMLTGLLAPDLGEVELFGINVDDEPERAKQSLAYLPDEPLIYPKLTPYEYLEFVAGLWGISASAASERADSLLRDLALIDVRNKPTEEFSRGMKQKLSLAGALIHEPRLIVLDEPLTGLDAHAARQIKDLLVARVDAGCTVILTSHILDVVEKLARRIGIIHRGKLMLDMPMQELRDRGQGASLEDIFLRLTSGASA
jgi:ABC-2 type transport system ATP-binding protein